MSFTVVETGARDVLNLLKVAIRSSGSQLGTSYGQADMRADAPSTAE